MSRKIADTKKMTHEEWINLRKSSIGGSDAGVCVGMNQYSSLITLYADKKGLSKEKETTEAMRLGTDLEAYVAERFTEKTGKKVRNDFGMYADDEYDFLTANIDRKVVSENAGLECKVMGSFNGYNLEAGEVPAHYYCQCQHYAMVMGFDKVYLAILVLQRGLYINEINRDNDFIAQMRKAEVDFWTNYVEKDITPEPDGSEASLDTLKELYPNAAKDSEINIPGLDSLIADYKSFGTIEKEFSEKKAKVQAQICAKLGSNEIGIGTDYGCSWKKQSKSGMDVKRFKEDHPDVYQQYATVSEYRVFRTKQIKKKEK